VSLSASPQASGPARSVSSAQSAIPTAARVLVVRLSAMGDIIHALPAITALRAARPDLQIGWLVEERWSQLLCSRPSEYFAGRSALKPLVDAIHIANFKTWRKALFSGETWREIGALRRQVRETHYEVALDLQGAMRSALAAQLSDAKVRIGSAKPREAPASMFYSQPVDPQGEHVVEQALSIASVVAGRVLQYADPLFPVDPTADAWANQLHTEWHGKRIAILNPGAGWGAKCWPAESFGAVARALAQRDLAVVVNHGPGEEALAEQVRESSGGTAIPLKCSIAELIALTRRANLFVGGDTGPMHLAAALRIPVVALFGPTRPERNGPYGTRSVVLRSPESLDTSTHSNRRDEGLASIQPHAVIEAANRLLREPRG
jgi:heptosyltransferase I